MNNVYASTTIILAEISIVLLILFGFMLFFYLRYILGDKKAVSAFTEKTKNSEEARKEKFKKLLKNNYNYDEEKLDEAIEKLTASENVFYKALTDIYLTKKTTALDNLDKNIEELATSYHNLIPDSGMSSEKMTATITQLNSEIDKLKAENIKITDDLNKLNEEMDNTVNEYASAFGSAQNAASDTLGKNKNPSDGGARPPEETAVKESQATSDPVTVSDNALKEINLEIDEHTEEYSGTTQESNGEISSPDDAFKEISLEMNEEPDEPSDFRQDSPETEPASSPEDAGETAEQLQDSESSPEPANKPAGEINDNYEDDILDPSRIETTEIDQDVPTENTPQKENKTGGLLNPPLTTKPDLENKDEPNTKPAGGLLNPPPVKIISKEEKLKSLLGNQKTDAPKNEDSEATHAPQDKKEPGSDLEDILNEIDLELDADLNQDMNESQDDNNFNSDLGNILKDIDLNENIDSSEGGGMFKESEESDNETVTREERKGS